MESGISTGLEALLGDYPLDGAYDEMRAPAGEVREHYRALAEMLTRMPMDELQRRKQAADLSFLTQGITFTVYGREEGTERIFPYDLLPRMVTAAEWATIERGLTQRITALNEFLRDVYSDAKILADKVLPSELVYSCKQYRQADARADGAAQRVHRGDRVGSAAAETRASLWCWRTTCACPRG